MKRYAIIIYLLSWLIIGMYIHLNDVSLKLLLTKDVLLTIHLLFVCLFLPILLINYLYVATKEKRLFYALKILSIRILLPITILVLSIRGILIYNQSENFNYTWDYAVENKANLATNLFNTDGKYRGLSIYDSGSNQNLKLQRIIETNVEWLAIHPYMSQVNESSTYISTPKKIGHWSKRDSTFIKIIREAKVKDLKTMLKPHLFLTDGWRANINFSSKSDWDTWCHNYKSNLLHYAYLAEQENVALFCIGTELESSVVNNEAFWLELVDDIRQIYSGKLVYAANWDSEVYNTNFQLWDALDYIGIQAYFPLTKSNYPNLETIKRGWDDHIRYLEQLNTKYNKPILFTELGYRADGQATVTPWQWDNLWTRLTRKKSEETQLLAYEAFFQKLWDKNWFAGVFIWKWNNSLDFAIERKPAQNCIAKWFAKNAEQY